MATRLSPLNELSSQYVLPHVKQVRVLATVQRFGADWSVFGGYALAGYVLFACCGPMRACNSIGLVLAQGLFEMGFSRRRAGDKELRSSSLGEPPPLPVAKAAFALPPALQPSVSEELVGEEEE